VLRERDVDDRGCALVLLQLLRHAQRHAADGQHRGGALARDDRVAGLLARGQQQRERAAGRRHLDLRRQVATGGPEGDHDAARRVVGRPRRARRAAVRRPEELQALAREGVKRGRPVGGDDAPVELQRVAVFGGVGRVHDLHARVGDGGGEAARVLAAPGHRRADGDAVFGRGGGGDGGRQVLVGAVVAGGKDGDKVGMLKQKLVRGGCGFVIGGDTGAPRVCCFLGRWRRSVVSDGSRTGLLRGWGRGLSSSRASSI